MNITPEECAAMVRDIESLKLTYEHSTDHPQGSKRGAFNRAMALNYSSLASALKEGISFEGVA